MKRLFSGAQPTGTLHLGNYIGAIKNWVELQNKYDCIFSIVDLHAITIEYNQKSMREKILDLAKTYIACGIEPDKAKLFIQSQVKQHTELMWILSTVTPLGELNRMTQFKDKAKQHSHNINLGLYSYPVLQAADILVYKAEFVPVGEDQIQHIEITREIARKFNFRFNTDYLPEPKELLSKGARLMGLDGDSKMSKSKNNFIGLDEDEKSIMNKLRGAKTDPARIKRTDSGNPKICNMFAWHKIFSSEEEQNKCSDGCKTAQIGCVDCKKILCANINKIIEPIRLKKQELDKDNDYIIDILKNGAVKCSNIAEETMIGVRDILGFNI
ncbi:MAG: tryptophan--tRNA ligase [Candidatus Muirbacterium halophilum]|nr:tryptophan--tRNA ligase [Candidatus Muirbacterium halophilum]MCK9476599.1 tryptophan--tRNA ligase [Candidatus Muirbacterium halophilum]